MERALPFDNIIRITYTKQGGRVLVQSKSRSPKNSAQIVFDYTICRAVKHKDVCVSSAVPEPHINVVP